MFEKHHTTSKDAEEEEFFLGKSSLPCEEHHDSSDRTIHGLVCRFRSPLVYLHAFVILLYIVLFMCLTFKPSTNSPHGPNLVYSKSPKSTTILANQYY